MKNLSLALNGALIIAVAVLYFIQFSGNKQPEETTENLDMAAVDSLSQSLKVMYVNTDSLWVNYQLVSERLARLEKKRNASERKVSSKTSSLEAQLGEMMQDYQSKGQALEASMSTLNESIANMRMKELQDLETNIGMFQRQAEQEVLALREQLANDLMQQEQNDTKEIHDKLSGYLKEYNSTHHFTYVMAYADGGGILLADPALDITSDIVDELNRRYAAEQAASETEKKED